jgi:hypothetical protein
MHGAMRACGQARVVEIETICSDVEEHRRRVETRAKECLA